MKASKGSGEIIGFTGKYLLCPKVFNHKVVAASRTADDSLVKLVHGVTKLLLDFVQ